jgi:hypothetical protein
MWTLAIEGKVLPPGSQRLPALWLVQVCILAVQVLAPVHRVGRVRDERSFGDEEGRRTGGAAAEGQDGVSDGEAGVAWDDGVDAQGWEG